MQLATFVLLEKYAFGGVESIEGKPLEIPKKVLSKYDFREIHQGHIAFSSSQLKGVAVM